MRLLVGLLAVLPAGVGASAGAATLRPLASLAGPYVHVFDLWDGAGGAGTRILGPGPGPGGRIVVGGAQLAAIAQEYGVDWHGGAADQAVLERPGQALPVEAVTAVLRPALLASGAAGEFDVALPFYDPPMMDAGALPRLVVESLAFDAASGRFSAVIEADGAAPLRLRLSGSIAQSVAVVVPTRRLAAGSVIGPGDLAVQRVRATLVSVPVASDAGACLGMQLRHAAFAGQPVPLADLTRPAEVIKGMRVMMALALPGLDVGAVGEALQDGAEGEPVLVRNPVSGAVLQAEVTGPGTVRIAPDAPVAQPLGAPGRSLSATLASR